MDSDRWQRLQQIFARAVAAAPQAREAMLREACGDDAELLREVQALLAHDATVDRGLERAVQSEAHTVLAEVDAQRRGQRFGAWEIVDAIAAGGMGTVYRARRADGAFDQTAALKLLSPTLLGEHGRRRLEAERRILAALSHPHIAHLLDGGTGADGVPYLVMEYVDGVPIDDYCNARGLDTAARLRLFLRVCDAVDYAHRNLVVHRDIKPSNLLVTADGTPKLLDFGISKLLDSADPALTVADQRLFTPARASPEQLSGGMITTATDVYALGVLLYELLAGTLPFAHAGRTSAQVVLDILHAAPERPSATVGRSSARLDAARRRGDALTAERLRRELDGDLDNIVLMALRKEPARRYASVQALAEDVRAVLEHRPVAARADTLAYRGAKFARRHRLGLGLTAGVALTMAALVGVYTWRLADERDRAAQAAAQANEVADFLVRVFRVADPLLTPGSSVTARELLENGARSIDQELSAQPAVRARMTHVIGRAYQSLSLYPEARAMLEKAVALRRALYADGHPDLQAVELDLGVALLALGEHERAITLLDGVLAAQDGAAVAPRPRARALRSLAVALYDSRLDRPRALRLMEEAVATVAALGGAAAPDHAHYLGELGHMLAVPGSFERGLAVLDEALALGVRLHGEHDPRTVDLRQKRASVLADLGRFEEARAALEHALAAGRQALGTDHVRIGYMLSRLGGVLVGLGRYGEAEARMREALAIIRLRHGDEHPRTIFMQENLANAILEQDRHGEALAMYQDSLRRVRARFGEAHPETLQTLGNLAGAYLRARRYGDALRALETLLARLPAGTAPQIIDLIRHGEALTGLGRFDRARTRLDEAHAIARATLPPQHDRTAEILAAQGRLQLARGRPDAAEPLLAAAVAMMATLHGDDNPRLAGLRSEWGGILLRLGRIDAARPLLRDSAAALARTLGSEHQATRAAQDRLRALARAAQG